jgi:hypothetical protein
MDTTGARKPRWPYAAAGIAVAAAVVIVATSLTGRWGRNPQEPPPPNIPPGPPVVVRNNFVPLPPLQDAPEPAASSTLVPAPIRPLLPAVQTESNTRVLASDGQSLVRLRPSAEMPAFAFAADDQPPERRILPAGPPARVPAADSSEATLPPDLAIDADRPGPQNDQTEDRTRQTVLDRPPLLRQSSSPFLRLTIPDPYENVTPVRMRQFPPDDHAPVTPGDLPPKPKLP